MAGPASLQNQAYEDDDVNRYVSCATAPTLYLQELQQIQQCANDTCSVLGQHKPIESGNYAINTI
jgi:hypothetical protein